MNAVALPPELMALLDVRQTIGVSLAICGNLVISIGLALTKHAHNINQNRPTPLPYVKVPLWWLGFLATVIGEIGNFASYGFTQASVVAPLGAVSVLANVFIATCWLGEGLGARKVIGCGLCIIGGFIIVMSRPQSSVTLDIDTFIKHVQDRIFAIYMVLLTAVVLLLVGFQDKYGHRHVAYYVLLCSLLGSVTVMACKGVSTFLNLWLSGQSATPFNTPVFYLIATVLACTAVLQVRYLNEAMENFGNMETVPVYYVLFTISTILGANILYKDFEDESENVLTSVSPLLAPWPLQLSLSAELTDLEDCAPNPGVKLLTSFGRDKLNSSSRPINGEAVEEAPASYTQCHRTLERQLDAATPSAQLAAGIIK
ncbi:MAG: hypothetical protein SGPRY_008714 [Prymnesium sp.]